MSQWTHVAGIIRLDSIGANTIRAPVEAKNNQIKASVTKALGNTCDYNSNEESWAQCSVPCGSEGSLQYSVHPNTEKDDHNLSWGYVAIWGDLRNFDMNDVPIIEEWFQRSIELLKKPERVKELEEVTMQEKAEYMLSVFLIRDAVLSIDVEFKPKLLLSWDDKAKKLLSSYLY